MESILLSFITPETAPIVVLLIAFNYYIIKQNNELKRDNKALRLAVFRVLQGEKITREDVFNPDETQPPTSEDTIPF